MDNPSKTSAAQAAIVRDADNFARQAGLRLRGITSDSGIAKALNASRVPTSRGGSWTTTTVRRLLDRIKKLLESATMTS